MTKSEKTLYFCIVNPDHHFYSYSSLQYSQCPSCNDNTFPWPGELEAYCGCEMCISLKKRIKRSNVSQED